MILALLQSGDPYFDLPPPDTDVLLDNRDLLSDHSGQLLVELFSRIIQLSNGPLMIFRSSHLTAHCPSLQTLQTFLEPLNVVVTLLVVLIQTGVVPWANGSRRLIV